MSTLATERLFVRAPGSLWRDTGMHVLVIPPGAGSEVTVLGGGGAAVWRLLAEPVGLRELRERLLDTLDEGPEPGTVAACVDALVARHVVSCLFEKDEL